MLNHLFDPKFLILANLFYLLVFSQKEFLAPCSLLRARKYFYFRGRIRKALSVSELAFFIRLGKDANRGGKAFKMH